LGTVRFVFSLLTFSLLYAELVTFEIMPLEIPVTLSIWRIEYPCKPNAVYIDLLSMHHCVVVVARVKVTTLSYPKIQPGKK
jgi:hypothetical protein